MANSRPFAYNTGSQVPGTEQLGSLAIGIDPQSSPGPGGLTWWNGPNESLGYVVAYPQPSGDHPTPTATDAYLGFFRSTSLTESSFVSLANYISNGATGTFTSGYQAKTWLNSNGYWTSYSYPITSGLKVYLDAGNSSSYSGSGTTWYDLSGNNNDVEMQNSGSISWTGGSTGYFSTGSNGWFTKSNASNVPTGNSSYTLSAWIQLGSTWNSNGIVSIGPFGSTNQSNAFRTGTTNQLINYWWGNDLSSIGSLSPTDSWLNAVAKFDGTTRSIWVNGVSIGSDTPVGHNVTNSDIQIAKTYSNEYLQGNIAQVLIYDVALSDAEILANFNSSKSRFGYNIIQSGLTLQLDAGNSESYPGSGSTWYDLASPQQNITLVNSPTYTSSSPSYFTFSSGSSQYGSGSGAVLSPTSYTKSVWFYLNSYVDNNILSSDTGGHYMFFQGGNKMYNGHSNWAGFPSNFPSTATFSLNTWYCATLTFNTTDGMKLYINGTLDSTYTAIKTAYTGNGSTNVACYSLGGNLLNGRIAKAYCYNRSLSSDEVLQNYEADRGQF